MHPIVYALMSLIIPGLGQLVMKQWLLGLIFLAIWGGILGWTHNPAGWIVGIVAAVLAYKDAEALR